MMIKELYDIIIKTEIKWMVLVNFAYDVLKKYNPDQYDYSLDLGLIKKETSVRVDKIKKNLLDALLQAPRGVWRCDPPDNLDSRAVLGEEILSYQNIYLNLEPVLTDITDTRWMIMTGARLRKRVIEIEGEKAEEIFLEIQQGVLMIDGSIDSSTLTWKNSLDKKNLQRYRIRVNETSMRLMAVDPLMKNVFLTGLQFFVEESTITVQAYHTIEPRNGTFVGHAIYPNFILPLRSKDIDENQELSDLVSDVKNFQKYVYMTRSFMGIRDPYKNLTRDEIARYKLDHSQIVPIEKSNTQCKHQSKTITRYFKHVVFEEISSDESDSGKLVVPFIDLQEIVTYPPTPLSGVSIYHKGTRGCKSYLALELMTQNSDERWYEA
ncbi:hypothetical protein QAD02_006664 [Eretmocerus hayati]|uniref:Uncharacterized protein n=1 Tax=Eretmocerus hayati TaxID=131215 RepID=A0ACC2N1W1_9HYME|nr:hypothetical protein QAD02_006664 [Eretmocerus hayati]